MSGSLIRFATELPFNLNPSFTKWLVKSGALREQFVLIDVGVLGGENPRWHFLDDYLVVHGFDASKEVVEDLSQSNAAFTNKTFHWFAIGNEDGDREFFFNPSNPSSSSLFNFPGTQNRVVPIRRLDTLLKEQVIPRADFLKVDIEGHERELFMGASDLLSAGLLGVDVETSFATSAVYPQAGFDVVRGLLTRHGLVISDLNFDRIRNETYQKARKQRRLPELPLEGAGKPATFNVLFCRNTAAEVNGSVYYEKLPPSPRVDQILKLMTIHELHGLSDIAVEIAMTFSSDLGRRLDVERAIDLLCENDGGALREYLLEVRGLKSSLVAARKHVQALHRELFERSNSQKKLGIRAVVGLEVIEAELNSALLTGRELPQPEQHTYEGNAQTDSAIPEDPKIVTRDHGAAILRISPPQSEGPSVLHVRILFNCHCSAPNNSVRIAVFQDGSERPLAVLTEDLIPGELTLVDRDFVAAVVDSSRPPILEFRVGLAHSGGLLSLNYVPQPAFASAVRMRWLPTEDTIGTVADGLPPATRAIRATSMKRQAEPESTASSTTQASAGRTRHGEAWVAVQTAERALLAKHDDVLAEQKRLAADKDVLLAQKDSLLIQLNALLVERETMLNEQKRLVGEKEALLRGYQSQIADRDAALNKQQGFLSEKDTLLDRLQEQVADQNLQIAETRAQAEATLQEIYNSRSWRMTSPARRLASRLRKKVVVKR